MRHIISILAILVFTNAAQARGGAFQVREDDFTILDYAVKFCPGVELEFLQKVAFYYKDVRGMNLKREDGTPLLFDRRPCNEAYNIKYKKPNAQDNLGYLKKETLSPSDRTRRSASDKLGRYYSVDEKQEHLRYERQKRQLEREKFELEKRKFELKKAESEENRRLNRKLAEQGKIVKYEIGGSVDVNID